MSDDAIKYEPADIFLTDNVSGQIRKLEDAAFLGFGKQTIERGTRAPYKAFNALVQGNRAETLWGDPGVQFYPYTEAELKTFKFDIDQVIQPRTYDTTTPRDTMLYDQWINTYYNMPAKPLISQHQIDQYRKLRDMIYGTSVLKEPETLVEAPASEKKLFRYSKYKDKAYMNSMVFWLTNPFKYDLLACTETNS